jgi:ubiquinone/menaquinone biosynthesis C-methylase UbiE
MTVESAIVRQFEKPTGLVGRIVGFVLANRGSNVRRSRWTVDLLELKPDDRVLEIACGPGVALKACLRRLKKGRAVGIDHSEVMIKQAGRRNARAVAKKRLVLISGTIDDLPRDEPLFEKVFSVNLIQFITDKEAYIAACLQHLAPNGTLATTCQPRGSRATRESALAMARTLTDFMTKAGLADVHTEILEERPVPAICVLGRKR